MRKDRSFKKNWIITSKSYDGKYPYTVLPGRRGEVRDRDNTSSSLQVSVHERGDTHADGVRCRGLRTLALITWKRLSLFNVVRKRVPSSGCVSLNGQLLQAFGNIAILLMGCLKGLM